MSVASIPHEERCPGPAAAAEVPVESYRYYLRAAVLIGALAGAALGAVNLTWIAVWGYTGLMPDWGWWPGLIQAHGNAQLYGWCGLFIIGIASHSIPRMLGKPSLPAGLARAIFLLVLGGLLLGLPAQPLAARPPFGTLFVLAMGLQWAGVTLFAVSLGRMLWPCREPYLGFVFAGLVWFWLGAAARLGLSLAALAGGAVTPPAAGNAAYLHGMTWGFLLSFVVGYSLRLLPAFTGSPAPRAGAAWAALALLHAGCASSVLGLWLGLKPLAAGAMALTVLGVGAAVAGLRLGAPTLAAEEPEARRLDRVTRIAYFWLAFAALVLLGLRAAQTVLPVSPLLEHAFGGAARHAATVGFVSLMIVGVAWRILPIFSGAPRAPAALETLVLGLLLTGNTLRVTGQIAAGLGGGAWYGVMGISGWLETLALTLFALDVVRLLSATPDTAVLPEAGPPVEVAPEAVVGPLVSHRPYLVPVFARHGMGQVSHPMFQRTVGRRVTVAQACRRFGVELEPFVNELRAAEAGRPAGAALS
jgi:uncharacterized protein involved in response to NO